MILKFNAFENMNYYDTVIKAIPGFFRYYDPKFAPQDTIITMDYPTIIPIKDCQGINAISQYVNYIELEQQFLSAFPVDYIIEVLSRYQNDYREQFYNICAIVERHILAHMLLFRELKETSKEMDYESLKHIIDQSDKEKLKTKLEDLLNQIVFEKYEGNIEMLEYLRYDCKDFVVELINAAHHNQLQRIVI